MKLPKLFFFLLSFFFISLLSVQTTHAQDARVSVSSHVEEGGNRLDKRIYVSKGDKLVFQISGLTTQTDYRIEMGDQTTDDAFIQYNLSWTQARQCGPASYSDTNPTETNKGQGLISITSCRVSGDSLTVIASIDTTSIPVNPGISAYTLYIKQGRTGNDFATQDGEDKLIFILPTPKVQTDQHGVTAGNTISSFLEYLAPYTSYGFSLRNQNGQTVWQEVTFTTGAPNSSSCTMTKNSQSFSYKGCTSTGNALAASFEINTAGFNCAPNTSNPQGTCTLYLTKNGNTVASTKFVVDTQQFDFRIEPNDVVSEAEIQKAGSPRANYNVYEGKDVKITAVGCSQSEVTFEWWRDSDKNAQCSTGTCFPIGEPDDSKTQSVSNGAASFTNEFGAEGKSEMYAVRATCEGKGPLVKSMRVLGEGEEYILVPAEIEADIAGWTMTLGGLDGRMSVDLDADYEGCYFFQIINQTDDSYVPNGGDRGDCNDDSVKGYVDNKYRDGEDAYYLASSDWDPSAEIPMPALAAGNYSVRLYRVDNGAEDDSAVAVRDFCVGGGAGCINEAVEDIPPPPPPCQKFNDLGECEEVNTAFGILKIDPTSVIPTIFTFLLSISGLIILLIIIRSAYILMTSQGNPEKVKEAQERITSAIVGFLFLIFSLVILETIGVDILHIPGFS